MHIGVFLIDASTLYRPIHAIKWETHNLTHRRFFHDNDNMSLYQYISKRFEIYWTPWYWTRTVLTSAGHSVNLKSICNKKCYWNLSVIKSITKKGYHDVIPIGLVLLFTHPCTTAISQYLCPIGSDINTSSPTHAAKLKMLKKKFHINTSWMSNRPLNFGTIFQKIPFKKELSVANFRGICEISNCGTVDLCGKRKILFSRTVKTEKVRTYSFNPSHPGPPNLAKMFISLENDGNRNKSINDWKVT